MRILFSSYCLWIIFISRAVEGQVDCPRTNRQASRKCATGCNPSTGCDSPLEECLCDADCGYSCVQKDLSCGRPPTVPRATPQYQSTSFGAVVTYACNPGYTLSGASQRTCRAIGKWDAVGPNCLQMCSIPQIEFSMYIKSPVNYNRTYRTGERVTLACKKGFKKGPGGNPIRICISGRWTQFPFKCEGTHSCRRTIRPARTKCTQECSPESGCGSDDYLCLCDGSCGYSCVQKGMSCGDPPAISNGQFNFTGTSYNDTAFYSCEEGYSLNTNPVKRCTAKKRWSGLTPRCLKDCGDPATPKHAIISNPSDNYPSGYKVIFKCNDGYNQEGMATQMCIQGQWTVLPFECSKGGCGDPGTPENGRKVGVIYSINSKVYFDCDLGYDLAGSEERKCQRNGTWTGRQPVCRGVDCGFPPKPKNGRYIGNQTTFQSSLRFECDEGYQLQGRKTRMCTSDKQWSGKEVTCEAVDCGKLFPPMNGSLSGEESTFPNQVEISCDEGFSLRGSRRRTCQADRTWSGSTTFCDGMSCGDPPAISNGQLNFTGTSFNDAAYFSCDEGYSLNTNPVMRCTAKRRWSGLTPRCLKDCGNPATPKNAIISNPSDNYPSGYKVIFKCNDGYNQEGMATQMCFQGQWTVLPFKCSEGGCGDPGTPENGRKVGVIYSINSKVYFDCDLGYELAGTEERKCQRNGTWTGRQPVCIVVDCGFPPKPKNGRYIGNQTTFQSSLRFECDEGYQLQGRKTRMCTSDKQWSGKEVTCEGMSCGDPPAISNGQLNSTGTSYNDTAYYSCDEGYSLNTNPVKRCTAEKRWSGLTPRCLKNCGDPATPKNAIISNPSDNYPSGYKVIFKCIDGYNQEGMATQMCFQGQWTVLPFKCSKGFCGDPGTPENGRKVGVIYSVNSRVYFDCDLGYELTGSEERECQQNGTWTGRQPVCRVTSCGHPPAISNGQINFTGTSFNDTAYYSCNEGYSLNTNPVKRCTADERWSGLTPRCLKDCGDPATPKNAIISNPSDNYPSGYKVIFKCNDGYNQEGIATQMCFQGQWTVLPFKCSKECNNPLGMQSRSIRDESITSSSKLDSHHEAYYGRLGGENAWCSTIEDENPHIEITLDEEKEITEIVTQGSLSDLIWSKKFEIEYLEGGNWTSYKQEHTGNRNCCRRRRNTLHPAIRTRSIRIYPKHPFGLMRQGRPTPACLRLELYGCSAPGSANGGQTVSGDGI